MAKSIKNKKLEQHARSEERLVVAETVLRESLALYESGRYVDACRTALQAGPLHLWRGVAAQTFGFRLAGNSGASRLAGLLISRARREGPQDGEAAVHYSYYLMQRRGLVPTWRHCLATESLPAIRPDQRSDLLAMRATVAAAYRDFETSWQLWQEAVNIHELTPWLLTEKCQILLSEERRSEALGALDEALHLRPWYRPAVQFRARVLHLLGQREEATAFLTEAMGRLQSCALAAQLMTLKREMDDHEGMEALADAYEKLAVLSDAESAEWIAARRMDLLTLRGDFQKAAAIAAQIPGDYCQALAIRLQAPGAAQRRVRLPFEFVHQKHNTCAPATLAAMAHFWERPITMEQITEAICYDGTYDHSERLWTQANGFSAREFTVTLDAAMQMIDLGLPFVLHTVEVGSGHAQAVIGYDRLRETLFIQDPSEPHYREVEAAEFLARYRLTGPRGMVMVPVEQAEKISALDLPDAGLYDCNHRFSAALASHDRVTAAAVLAEMAAAAPGHRLVLMAQFSLANFDGNEVERLAGLHALLQMFPGDPRLLSWKNVALSTMGHRDERLQLLREAVKNEGDPNAFALAKNLVDTLMEDARDWDEARRLAWRVHTRMPGDAGTLMTLAEVLRRTQRAPVDEWLTFHRFAAALADKNETVAQTWFDHARSQGGTDQALAWLRQRWKQYGTKSSGPAITLAQALDSMCLPEALDVLRAAVDARPEDGELLVSLSRVESRVGEHVVAAELLDRAQGRCPPRQWLRARAALYRRAGDHASEMATWRQILANEPLALDAHSWIARELASTLGPNAALKHLAEICTRFPHHHGLARLHIGWLRESDHKQAEQEARRVIALHPAEPWVLRELALILQDMGRAEEAVQPALQAVFIAPDQAAGHSVLGIVLAACKRDAEAAEHFQKAIRLDVNYAPAFSGLISLCADTAAKREKLAFIRSEMIRQVLTGDALHAYRELAFSVLSPEELLAELREIWQARPDLWEAWSVLLGQMIDSGHKQEAILPAQEATQKFALIPGSWRDMALVWRAVDRPDAALACARHVVKLTPDWADGWCLLAGYLEDAGQGAEAVETLRQARTRLPLDMTIRRSLAHLLWQTGQREEAWQMAEDVTQEDPGQNWAWGSLKIWAATLQRSSRVIDTARRLTQTRPDEARSWILLAKLLPMENIREILDAAEKATQLNPWLVDAWDFRMEVLAGLGRLDEAEAIPAKGPWGREDVPPTLLGRLAWLQAARGNIPAAMRQMREVLKKHTEYYWGWKMYGQWGEQRKDLGACRHAAEEMVRLAPRSPDAHCAAADAALNTGDREQGIRHLQQALLVDPTSPYAAYRLLELYWEKRDIASLRSTAAALPSIGQTALICRIYLMLAAAHKDDLMQVGSDLAWLATHPDMMGDMLQLILDCFTSKQRSLAPLLDGALSTVAENNTIGPAFAILWVQRETQKQHWDCWKRLAEWLPRLGSRLDAVGQARHASPHVSSFIQACGTELRQRGVLWAKVGYALAASGAFRECTDWLGQDYQRDDAEAWTLWNLAISYRKTQRPEQAGEVCLHVVEKGLRDNTWSSHSALAALACAWKQDYDKARLLLDNAGDNDNA
jgi:cellulose synthase operon protein C